MKAPLSIAITGANGFVGRATVAAALDRGHRVTAFVRPASSAAGVGSSGVGTPQQMPKIARVDLRDRSAIVDALDDVDVVIHLAAAKAGDFYTQFGVTVSATELLLDAMETANVARLVGVSTFSIYDWINIKPGTVLDEQSPVISRAAPHRDAYSITKLIQEGLYRDFGARENNDVIIVRPGMIYGPDNLWHALLGSPLGSRFLRIGKSAVLPITYVENTADALICAAELDAGNGATINIVDDDLPTQQEFVEELQAVPGPPVLATVPWPVARAIGAGFGLANKVLFHGTAKFPGLVVAESLHARFKPLLFSNVRAKQVLGWTPRFPLGEAVRRSVEASEAEQSPAVADRS